MIKSIFVILEDKSVSFCHYKIKDNFNKLSIERLKNIIQYSKDNNLFINYLFSSTKLSTEYINLINSSKHLKIIPLELYNYYDGLIVINKKNFKLINKLEGNKANIILKINKEELNDLAEKINCLITKCKRINLSLLNIDKFTDYDLEKYYKQLKIIKEDIISEYKLGHSIELNFLSDRIFLQEMNNCNPGIDHITFAPNGNFYICPGFYYTDPDNNSGNIEIGVKLKYKKKLKLKNTEFCKICDAYQCKRCIFLNKKITGELNSPSYQQCIISHYERNTSKNILNTLKFTNNFEDFNNIPPISSIQYNDPYLSAIVKTESTQTIKHKSINNNHNKNIINENKEIKELIKNIYKIQKDILKEFNK